MSDTFKDVSTVRGYKPNLIDGRSKQKEAGYKEKFDGTTRMTRQGRLDTFLNEAKPPKLFDKSKNARLYPK